MSKSLEHFAEDNGIANKYEKMPNLPHNKINARGNYTQIPFVAYQIGKKRIS